MVLHRQLEVRQRDSDACRDDVEDDEDEAEDAVECVEGVAPHTAVDVEQLNVDRAEGQETGHQHLEGQGAVPKEKEKEKRKG